MNKSILLIQNIDELLQNTSSGHQQIIYDSSKGLELIRYGGKDRFSSPVNTHYNKAPLTRGTWASIAPFSMLTPFPDEHNKVHQGLSDQTNFQKSLYPSNTDTNLLKPITFFWNHAIYSHIDKTGSYQNKGWTFYPNVQQLVQTIKNNASRIYQTVSIAQNNSTNLGGNSDMTYFKNHEWEVFVPTENVKGGQ